MARAEQRQCPRPPELLRRAVPLRQGRGPDMAVQGASSRARVRALSR